jgi:CRISPR/Cas system-associated endonuclease Cas1
MLNYLYALLFSETRLALLTAGLDPMAGIFHADQYRDAFVYNIMEGVRSDVDV